jgi:pyocin large subunit-like protein
MSAAAARWAKKQKAGGSGRKAVLMMLAHLADKIGELQASVAAIGEACEMSADVVKDHLDHLAKIGLIEREACYREDGGRAANKIVIRHKTQRRATAAPEPAETGAAIGQWGRA